jgi:hypothetical protein
VPLRARWPALRAPAGMLPLFCVFAPDLLVTS